MWGQQQPPHGPSTPALCTALCRALCRAQRRTIQQQCPALGHRLSHGNHPSGAAPAQPHKRQLSQPSCPTAVCSPGLQLYLRGSCRALHGLCLLQASSTAALWAPPWLHVEICSVWCPWAAGDSLLLCGPLLGCRELLLCAWSSSCPPSVLTSVPAGLLSHIPCFSLPTAVAQ